MVSVYVRLRNNEFKELRELSNYKLQTENNLINISNKNLKELRWQTTINLCHLLITFQLNERPVMFAKGSMD